VADGTRRLAAVMFTDLVGFTKIGQRDEEAALRLRRDHQALVRPLLERHGGREVKTLGDGFLIEFPSAVESVRCAIAIQQAAAARNAQGGADPAIVLRIGIHVGDVVQEGGDIVGDAVNVASRIEPIAEPGGICVSGSVFEQVRNKVGLPLEKLGSRALKNVEEPVELYRVRLAAGPPPAALPRRETESSLRLAILPLANLSPEPSDEYFADGLTEELISQVGRIPSVRVIARTSVLRYKGSSKSIREVAQDLAVGLALEGSVRKAGNQLRITVQLVDARSEEPLWSSRYDRPLDDIFSIQDDIASRVAQSISGHLLSKGVTTVVPFVRGSAETPNLEAYTRYLQGLKLLTEKANAGTVRVALEHFDAAVRLDPQFARARVGAAESLLWLAGEGGIPFRSAVDRAREELRIALESKPDLAEAHSALASLLVGEDEGPGAEREARRALELNPSLADPYRWLAQLAAGDRRIGETVRLLEVAQQLDPVDINVLSFLGRSYLYAGREKDALAHWQRTLPLAPYRTNAHLTEYFLGLGDLARAEATVRELERLRPDSLWTEMYRGVLAAKQGDPALARRILERLDQRAERGEFTVMHAGFVHFALGEEDAFVACMERSFQEHNLPLLELTYSRLFAAARDDPRIIDLLHRQAALQPPAS
jgi:adenylate cyclase